MIKFQQSQCDVIIFEAGLGGREDATNIFDGHNVALSVITSVQLDHQQILGNTIAQIAIEKAGIMKCNVDVLVGPHTPVVLLQVRSVYVCVCCVTCVMRIICNIQCSFKTLEDYFVLHKFVSIH